MPERRWIITLEELEWHARLTGDVPTDDLLVLQQKADAAHDYIERLIGRPLGVPLPGETVAWAPEGLRECVLQLACWWFENREAATDSDRHLPFGVKDIVKEYRGWTF